MKEIRVKSWEDFLLTVDALTKHPIDNKRHIFRGHSDCSWTLQTTLSRSLPEEANLEAALMIEKAALLQFKAVAHFHLPTPIIVHADEFTTKVVGWWTLMQHYGAPTRILDWTASPYVATYFAVKEFTDTDAAIFCLDSVRYNKILDNLNSEAHDLFSNDGIFADKSAPEYIYIIERGRLTDRMAAQQGVFTISKNILADHHDILEKTINNSDEKDILVKIVIPAKEKLYFLGKLRRMNITGQSLFPGADGIGKSISEMISLSKFGSSGV